MTMLISLAVPSQNSVRALAVSTTSAQTGVINGGNVVLQSDVAGFIVRGQNPTAVVPTTGGTLGGLPVLAGVAYRVTGLRQGEKLAFITASGTGTLYYAEAS